MFFLFTIIPRGLSKLAGKEKYLLFNFFDTIIFATRISVSLQFHFHNCLKHLKLAKGNKLSKEPTTAAFLLLCSFFGISAIKKSHITVFS